MSDPIRDFIQQHRSEMDTALPETPGWSTIERILARLPQADALEKTLLYEHHRLDTEVPSPAAWEHIASTLHGSTSPADQLEHFIRQHRDDLDATQPDLRVWGHIAQQLPRTGAGTSASRVSLLSPDILLRAAASIALVLLGVGLGMWYSQRADSPGAGMAMSEVSAEYRELEDYYRRDIAVKEERLARFAGHQPEEVNQDLQQMDYVMQELRQELAHVPPGNREQVVRMMIENYKAKSAVLQRVLQHMEAPPFQSPPNNDKQHDKARI